MKRRISTQGNGAAERNDIRMPQESTIPFNSVLDMPQTTSKARSDDGSVMADDVFTACQEAELLNLLTLLHNHMFSLDENDIRRCIYEYAEHKRLILCKTETDIYDGIHICKRVTYTKHRVLEEFKVMDRMIKQTKGSGEWVTQFLSRNSNIIQPILSRVPFSAHSSVAQFYKRFKRACEIVESSPDRIYNAVEVIITPDAVTGKGSAELGEGSMNFEFSAVGEICASASGAYMLPTVVLRNRPRIIKYGKWMKPKSFYEWFEKFIHFSKPTSQKPVLLLIHGEAVYMKSVIFVMKALRNHVVLICCPFHMSMDVQPLDVAFVPYLSGLYYEAVKKWQLSHQGETVSKECRLKHFVEAFEKAKSTSKIDGFSASGIYPVNIHVFEDLIYKKICHSASVKKKNQNCIAQDYTRLPIVNTGSAPTIAHSLKSTEMTKRSSKVQGEQRQEIVGFIDLTVMDTEVSILTDVQKPDGVQIKNQSDMQSLKEGKAEHIADLGTPIQMEEEIEENPWIVSPEPEFHEDEQTPELSFPDFIQIDDYSG